MKRLSIVFLILCLLLPSIFLTANCADHSPVISVSASTSLIQAGAPVTFSASVSDIEAPLSYSFYILKDGKVLIRTMRSADNTITFTPMETGAYQLRVYVEGAGRQRISQAISFLVQEQGVSSLSLGFNAKGSLNPQEQTDFFRVKLEEMKAQGKATDQIYIRLQGGTLSQKTYPSDWSEDNISSWAKIQEDFGCPFIFVVNLNDSAESQLAFYNRMVQHGMEFCMIELGNEQYLAKYTQSKVDEFEEVTDRTAGMTPEKYAALCNEYIDVFPDTIKFGVQFAPDKEGNKNMTAWNTSMADLINSNAFHTSHLVGTVHLYERDGAGSLNEKQILDLKKSVQVNLPIAVTEYGAIDSTGTLSENELISQEIDLTNRLISCLDSGDILLNQLLYTDYKTVGAAAFHPQYLGITPKGTAIFDLFGNYWN